MTRRGKQHCSGTFLTEQPVPHTKQPNVICELPGATEQTIVVGAHFDHVDRGVGIVDNWSGASLLPSLFQGLSFQNRKHTFVFIGFSGEEKGLFGSSFFVKKLPTSEISKIEAMVNLDTLGLSPTKIWVSQSDPWLTKLIHSVSLSMKVPLSGMELNRYGESDEESFISKKICALSVHSLTPETAHMLHQPEDNPSSIRFNDYFDTYRLMARFLSVLDSTPVPQAHICWAKPIEPSIPISHRLLGMRQ